MDGHPGLQRHRLAQSQGVGGAVVEPDAVAVRVAVLDQPLELVEVLLGLRARQPTAPVLRVDGHGHGQVAQARVAHELVVLALDPGHVLPRDGPSVVRLPDRATVLLRHARGAPQLSGGVPP